VTERFSEEQIVKIEGARSGPKIAAQPGGDGGQILFVQKPTPLLQMLASNESETSAQIRGHPKCAGHRVAAVTMSKTAATTVAPEGCSLEGSTSVSED